MTPHEKVALKARIRVHAKRMNVWQRFVKSRDRYLARMVACQLGAAPEVRKSYSDCALEAWQEAWADIMGLREGRILARQCTHEQALAWVVKNLGFEVCAADAPGATAWALYTQAKRDPKFASQLLLNAAKGSGSVPGPPRESAK